ncbi:DivIVA domain-containing protein [Micromonospora sp. NPDC003776]
MTADRVRRWHFEAASFTRRGYEPTDVDRFRIQVADELDHLATQIANLQAEHARLNDHLELHRHGVLPSTDTAGKLPAAEQVNVVSAAQREAEQIIAQAHDYASRVAEYARVQYEAHVQAAVDNARREAEQAVRDGQRNGSGTFNRTASQEALRIFGEMMISHLQSVARQLDEGSEQLVGTMNRMAAPSAGNGQSQDGSPRRPTRQHTHR